MKICFMGTPSFASQSLQALIDNHYNVSCVYTRAPKPKGRKHQLSESDVHKLALQHNIEVKTPNSFSKSLEAQEDFIKQNFDLAIVASYGLILPQKILVAPKHGCINIHASLLPKWRGSSPIQMAILSGDTHTGITIMQMDTGVDTGDIILQEPLPITSNTTFPMLYNALTTLGAKLLLQTLDLLQKNSLNHKPQNNNLATHTKMLKKTDGIINFNNSAIHIERQIRAFNPFPSSYIIYQNEIIKILSATVIAEQHSYIPATVISLNPLIIACGKGLLKIITLQRQGKKALLAEEFIRGFTFTQGELLS